MINVISEILITSVTILDMKMVSFETIKYFWQSFNQVHTLNKYLLYYAMSFGEKKIFLIPFTIDLSWELINICRVR
jgi:hypothetical protein